MDLNIKILKEIQSSLSKLPSSPPAILGYLSPKKEMIAIQALPGAKLISSYMDGSRELGISYQVNYQSETSEAAQSILWAIENALSNLDIDPPVSDDGSFVYQSNELNSAPFYDGTTEDGFNVFSYQFTINVYQERKKEI